jgi:hypothetical protein
MPKDFSCRFRSVYSVVKHIGNIALGAFSIKNLRVVLYIVMNAIEQIEAVSRFFLRLKQERPDASLVSFKNIKDVTGVPTKETQQILELLRKEKFMHFEYMPFDDHEKVFTMFDKDKDYQDPKGAITFFILPNKISAIPTEIGHIDIPRLKKLVKSKTMLNELSTKLRVEIIFEIGTSELVSGTKRTVLHSHNSRIVAEEIFKHSFGTRIPEENIESLFENEHTAINYRFIYNIVSRINEKIEEITGIHNLVQFKQAQIWIE